MIAPRVASTLSTSQGDHYSPRGDSSDTLIVFNPQVTHPENRSRCDPGAPAPSLIHQGHPHCVAYSVFPKSGGGKKLRALEVERAPAITATEARKTDRGVRLAGDEGVRRLLPVEHERLQAFPDGWTAIRGASDAARYKTTGNAVAVAVIEWIGWRLALLCEGRSPRPSSARSPRSSKRAKGSRGSGQRGEA